MVGARVTRRGFLAGGLGALLAGLRPLAGLASTPKRVEVICRKAWRAAPPRDGLRKHRIRRPTVHHSAVVLSDNRYAPARFRSHQQTHLGNGWPDIAYHLLIDRNGNVYRGRNPRFRGDTATDYDPAGHLLVLCEGDFDRQSLSGKQATALVDVLAWACERYGMKPEAIRGHSDWASTSCPGRRLQARIESRRIRDRVRSRLRQGGVELRGLCGEAGRRRVRRIERGEA